MIDHLVVAAASLAAGAEHVRRALGVEPQPGGEHDRMGTHNLLLKLGPALYLEVIAVNPKAPPPGRPRWFGLDAPVPQPRLATWVASTPDIASAPAALGKAERFTRGPYAWQITIPPAGRMPFGGIAPAMIQWESEHAAARLENRGCSLVKLQGFHQDPEGVKRLIDCPGFTVEHGATALVATIQTPAGTRTLR